MSTKTMAEVLEELWAAGNCTGLDGWIGPGRGAIEVDDVALDDRRRDVEKATAALTAAGFGLVADAKAEEFYEPTGSAAKGWDEGFARATFLAAWAIGGRAGDRPSTANPYRPVVDRGEG